MKILRLIFIFGLFLLPSCIFRPSYEDLLHKSQDLINEGQYYQALHFLEKAKTLRPDDEKVWLLLGKTSLWAGRPYQAIRYFETAINLNPKNSEALIKLGYLYLVTGYYNKAYKIAQKILQVDPNNIYASLIVGNLKAFQGDFKIAQKYFEDVLQHNPQNFRCYLEMADFYLLLRQYQKALSLYRKAQELAPRRPEVYIALGHYYMALQDWEKTEKFFKKAIEFAPADSYEGRNYKAYLAEFYVKRRAGDKALTLYKALLRQDPSNYYFLIRYVEIALHLNYFDEAQRGLKELAHYYPDLFAVPYLQGHLNLAQGHYKEAVTTFQEATLRSDDPRAYYFLGIAQWLSGLYRQAMVSLSKAVFQNSLFLEARLALASLELQLQEPALAVKELEPILPYSPEAHVLALIARLKLNDCQGATQEWRILQRLDLPHRKFWYIVWRSRCGVVKPSQEEKWPLAAWVLFSQRPSLIKERIKGPADFLQALELALYAQKGYWPKVQESLEPIDPKTLPLAYLKALVLAKEGLYPGALLLLQKVTDRFPSFLPAHILLGSLYLSQDDYEAAAKAFRQALAYRPLDATVLNNLAWALLHLNNQEYFKEALNLAERARDLAPEDPAIIDTLALAYHLAGMREVACRTIRRAQELAPHDRIVAEHVQEFCTR